MLRDAGMSKVAHPGNGVQPAGANARDAAVVLEQFSTRVPPDLLARLRVAAPQLGLRQSDIATTAIDRFLRRRGF